MPVFNIKDSEARALATRLTRITGESLTTAVKRALSGRLASEACRDFGKRSGHAARLNLRDRFAYVLSKAHGEPLLFRCDDFSRTSADVFP